MVSQLPPKKDVLEALLERSSVYIHLDPRLEAVRVPPWFKKQHQLVLQVGLNMPVPIRDLHIDDDAVSCTLSFSRTPHFCYIPWGSVYALIGEDQKGMVWPGEIPPEVAAQQQEQSAAAKRKSDGRRLRAVPDESSPAAAGRRDDDTAQEDSAAEHGDTDGDVDAGTAQADPATDAKRVAETDDGEVGEAASDDGEDAQNEAGAATSAEAASDADDADAPSEPAKPSTDTNTDEPSPDRPSGPRGKRQLPPYLRVVK